MTIHYTDSAVTLHHGHCLDVVRTLPDASVDAVVTDPPYGLEFMGKDWDAPWKTGNGFRRADNPADAGRNNIFGRQSRRGPEYIAGRGFQQWCTEWTAECLRVLKPGGHLLAFGGTRTWHRLAVAVEDAGFEVRDSIAWLYGSGFPKSLDVFKAIDKAAGAERLVVGERRKLQSYGSTGTGEVNAVYGGGPDKGGVLQITAPATDVARQWQGWGTALKPAFEPIVVARKPFAGTVAGNVLAHGTGAINVDATRIPTTDKLTGSGTPPLQYGGANSRPFHATAEARGISQHEAGRWPTNVALDGDMADELDDQSGTLKSGANPTRRGSDRFRDTYGEFRGQEECTPARGADEGGASRFFPVFRYEAKAPTSERPREGDTAHPTVKPLELMRWLVRLVTPPGGLVLDPFAGSGTTAEACVIEGFRCITIEREANYLPLIVGRLSKPIQAVLL